MTDDKDKPMLEVETGNWTIIVVIFIVCMTILGVCFAGTYAIINWPQT